MVKIEKVRPRLERRKKPPYIKLVRYEGEWIMTAYGAFWITAATRKGIEKKMLIEQGRMFTDG